MDGVCGHFLSTILMLQRGQQLKHNAWVTTGVGALCVPLSNKHRGEENHKCCQWDEHIAQVMAEVRWQFCHAWCPLANGFARKPGMERLHGVMA
jgi:hypothetical protein